MLSSYAVISASNLSIFIVLCASFYIIFSLLHSRVKAENLDQKSIIDLFFSLLYHNALRIPLGFLAIISGFILRITPGLPVPWFALDVSVLDTIAEVFVYTGFAIVFWPSILVMMYKMFGLEHRPIFYSNMAIFLLIVTKIFITFCGLMLYYFFVL